MVCDTYIAPLQVPQGARIKSITAYFYLTEEMGAGRFEHACGYVHFWLVRVPLTGVLGTLEELADATPVGPASAVSVVSAHAVVSKGATVNHADYTYTLVLDLPHFEVSYASNGSKVWFKGAQVRYESVGPY
ncbi:MAG: hypothetical protein FJZ90_12115 [Chloroflexi bacterium]|nr:hypothetical protein [Chloroflexota bacterium]